LKSKIYNIARDSKFITIILYYFSLYNNAEKEAKRIIDENNGCKNLLIKNVRSKYNIKQNYLIEKAKLVV